MKVGKYMESHIYMEICAFNLFTLVLLNSLLGGAQYSGNPNVCVHLSLQMQLVKTKHMVLYEAYCYCSLPALEVLIFLALWDVKYCPILAKGEHGFETIIFGRSLFKIIIIFSRHPTFYHKNINVRTVTDVRCIANTITDINILSRLDLGEGAVFYQGHFK